MNESTQDVQYESYALSHYYNEYRCCNGDERLSDGKRSILSIDIPEKNELAHKNANLCLSWNRIYFQACLIAFFEAKCFTT